MKYEIKNRVSESKLVTIDFNDFLKGLYIEEFDICLLYTSDAADE